MSWPAHALLTLWILFSPVVMPLGQAWSALPPVAGCGAHTEMAMGECCSGCPSGEACSAGGCFACHCAAAFFPIPPNNARTHADLSTDSIPVPVDPAAYTSLEPSPLYRPPKA